MTDAILRVHPAIGFARVGNSDAYYLAPETPAAYPTENSATTGGLPIQAGTESETITDKDIRDADGAFKKQTARFRIFQYPNDFTLERYPTGMGEEVTLGSTVGFSEQKTVKGIIWTVHLANKKANCYVLPEPDTKGDQIIDRYKDCKHPKLRNPSFGTDLNAADRRTKLQIDPGPRAIVVAPGTPTLGPVRFDADTVASYWESGTTISTNPNYPTSFPSMHFPDLYCPEEGIPSLGAIEAEPNGRLLVTPANGTACGFTKQAELNDDVNNDNWFDDVADGPVWATVFFDDGSTQVVQGGWVITTDPGYAPQTLNVVSLWDDIYNTFVEKLALNPDLFSNGQYNKKYVVSFMDAIFPIFRAAWMQQWNTNLPEAAKAGHQSLNTYTELVLGGDAPPDPKEWLNVPSIIRDPNTWETQSEIGSPRMPLSLGDSGMSFLMVTTTQYFQLMQWFNGTFSMEGEAPVGLGSGEYLDWVSLINCLGGRYSPGIDMTFIVRQPGLWKPNWKADGPFRINAQMLDYSKATKDTPFLTAGWFPLRGEGCPPFSQGVEPGDTSKFMALPWHTDYNSCATHTPAPNPAQNLTLYWSWPAQRPVAVYVASDVKDGKLGKQRFSVRGEGTATKAAAEVGRYQDRINIVKNWHKIGVVIQATAVEGEKLPDDFYLEVQSQLDDSGNAVLPWPNTIRDRTKPA